MGKTLIAMLREAWKEFVPPRPDFRQVSEVDVQRYGKHGDVASRPATYREIVEVRHYIK